MDYRYLDADQRREIRERAIVELRQKLRQLETEHFRHEVDYRLAAKLSPPDSARMAKARQAQASLDDEYAILAADADVAKGA